jgi:uncharacterized protein YlxP (DUF503 family)
VSVLGDASAKEGSLDGLRAAHGFLQRRIAGELRLKNTPTLVFAIDETAERGQRISDLIDRELAPVKAFLANRIGAAVSEVGYQDTWQRAMLVAALTGDAPGRLEATGDAVQGWLDGRFPQGARVELTLHSLEDLSA